MSNTNEEGWTEGMADFYITFDDVWSRMFVEDILKLKDKLLNPKRSDEFKVPLYLEGWRYCDVKIGSKVCTIKPFSKGKAHKISTRLFKEELYQTYWSAALSHSGRKGKRQRNWRTLYA